MSNDKARELVGKLLKHKDFRKGLTAAQARLEAFDREEMPAIRTAIEAQRQRFQQSRFGVSTTDDWVENLLYIADIVEIDPAGLSADEIERKARAWLARERLREEMGAKIQQDAFPVRSPVAENQGTGVVLHDDGPDKNRPGTFYWANSLHLIGKRNWQLCTAIWQNSGITFLDVSQEVWGNESTKASTIKSALSRLNAEMANLQIPLSWVNRSERIYLDDSSPQ